MGSLLGPICMGRLEGRTLPGPQPETVWRRPEILSLLAAMVFLFSAASMVKWAGTKTKSSAVTSLLSGLELELDSLLATGLRVALTCVATGGDAENPPMKEKKRLKNEDYVRCK